MAQPQVVKAKQSESTLIIECHPGLTPPMHRDVHAVSALPLRRWSRWNHEITNELIAAGGNCHYAAPALLLDLVEASKARGWRVASGMARLRVQEDPVLHSWLESPAGAVLDASQVYRVGTAYAAPRETWFREFDVRPLVVRRPGQIAHAARRYGFATAAVLPFAQLLEAGFISSLF